MNGIPLFIHIPRCAGTYTFELLNNFFDYITPNKQIILITSYGKILFILFVKCHDQLLNLFPDAIRHPLGQEIYTLSEDKINSSILNKVLIAIIVEANGLKSINKEKWLLDIKKESKLPVISFLTIRDPYSRIYSLYEYLKSPLSKHEMTHQKVKGETFEDYILSDSFEENWVVRQTCGLPNDHTLTDKDYENCCQQMDQFLLDDYKKVDLLVDKVIKLCYGNFSIDGREIFFKNSRKKVEIPNFNNLPSYIKDVFLEKTKYDQMIYNRYVHSLP